MVMFAVHGEPERRQVGKLVALRLWERLGRLRDIVQERTQGACRRYGGVELAD